MKAFADTNWLVASYFPTLDPLRTAVVDRFAKKADVPWFVSIVVHLECENSFRLVGGESHPPEWSSMQADVGNRIKLTEDSWEAIASKTIELLHRNSHKARLGTLDMMVLASALKAEATHFLSFDTRSNLRALAAVLKLKVFPELTAEDKRRMTAFR